MDSSGHFETQYTAPADKEPGQYIWWAVDGPTGISSNQVTYTIEEPPVNPTIAQSPMSGVPGTTFTQWGTGFTPNSTATLHFKKPDGTEYPTQQQAMDSSGHFETQYTAPADKEPGQYIWWAVDGPTGISSNQVTYTIEEPTKGYFSFNAISSQVLQFPFSVAVTARNADGTIKTELNGNVELSSNIGRTNPERIPLVNGQWTGNLTLYNFGTASLSANGFDLKGKSNTFPVAEASSCTAVIKGKVVDVNDLPVADATVILRDTNGNLVASQYSNDDGVFSFMENCGTYVLNISKGTVNTGDLKIEIGEKLQGSIKKYKLNTTEVSKIPVIIIPGILGSTLYPSWHRFYPLLPKEKGLHSLGIHKPVYTGFAALHDELSPLFNVIECPWDWRMDVADAAEEYLEPIVKKYSSTSPTGKVHIVAHSMGGLLARAYIQKSADNAAKVDHFAMVGTPNQGSCNAYYIWDGGAPKFIDDLTDSGFESGVNFYTNSIKRLWEKTYNKKGWRDKRYRQIRAFVRNNSPSLRELMPTEEVLLRDGIPDDVSAGNVNTTLNNLNYGEAGFNSPESCMSPDGSNGTKVKTGLFVGRQKDTVTAISVDEAYGKPWQLMHIWEDGKPTYDPEKTVQKGEGDGTVPYTSAKYPWDAGWASLEESSSSESHAFLVKDYTGEIAIFLSDGAMAAQTTGEKTTNFAAMSVSSEPTSHLSLAVQGTVRFDITGPTSNHTGVNPATGNISEDISGTTLFFDGEHGSTNINEPADGTYQVVVFGPENRDFHIDIGFEDETVSEQYSFSGHCGSSNISFEIFVDKAASPRVSLVLPAQPPENLQATPAGTPGAKTTTLTWNVSTEAGVSGYAIYSVTDAAPYFSKIATVAAGTTSYSTSDPWAGDTVTPVMTYAVTALKTDGTESFYSNSVQNDDRDHDLLSDAEETEIGTDLTKPDTDDDGYTDYKEIVEIGSNPLDSDTDDDGFLDSQDAFPSDSSEWTDTDEDGIGNNADLDDDNDGFLDTDDAFPLDPDENADTDGDGTGDNADLDDNMYPDLAVISQSLDKGGVAPGEDFTYSARVQNKGTGRARTSTIRYYLSPDSTIDSNDTLLGSKSVPVLNSGETSWDYINLNAPAELGKYWVGSCVDAISGDSDTTNNCRSSFPITVATNLPDLIISKLSSPSSAEAGKTFNVTQEIKNQGNLDATPTTANLYYMDIAAQTTSGVIHQEQVPALAVSQTVSQSPNIKAPCAAGDYLLSACVNSGENIEFGGNNNCTMNFFTVTGVCSEEPEKSFLPAIKLLLQ